MNTYSYKNRSDKLNVKQIQIHIYIDTYKYIFMIKNKEINKTSEYLNLFLN